jgi:hypothetical protein
LEFLDTIERIKELIRIIKHKKKQKKILSVLCEVDSSSGEDDFCSVASSSTMNEF